MAGLAVVLDTNVLLSGLAYPASVPGRLIAACAAPCPGCPTGMGSRRR
jgi:hypothetical protein